jgi:hypothetical protein
MFHLSLTSTVIKSALSYGEISYAYESHLRSGCLEFKKQGSFKMSCYPHHPPPSWASASGAAAVDSPTGRS